MRKIETVWHQILLEALTTRRFQLTQQELARRFGYSLSTIHHALRVPTEMGAIRKTGKAFVLQDFKKLLYFWASVRAFHRDVLYATASDAPIREIEVSAIPDSVYGAYSAAKRLLGEPPADYSKVYFYIAPQDLATFQRRFPPSSGPPANTFALKMAAVMPQYGATTTLVQTFVDLWNLSDWYAREFTRAIEEKMDALLSRSRD